MGSIMGPTVDKISVVYVFWKHCQKTCVGLHPQLQCFEYMN